MQTSSFSDFFQSPNFQEFLVELDYSWKLVKRIVKVITLAIVAVLGLLEGLIYFLEPYWGKLKARIHEAASKIQHPVFQFIAGLTEDTSELSKAINNLDNHTGLVFRTKDGGTWTPAVGCSIPASKLQEEVDSVLTKEEEAKLIEIINTESPLESNNPWWAKATVDSDLAKLGIRSEVFVKGSNGLTTYVDNLKEP